MLFKFALRNILRNKKRTLLTALSIFFAVMIVILTIGWTDGVIQLMIENYITFQTGNVKVMTDEFNKRSKFLPVDTLVSDSDALIEKIKKINGVKKTEERIMFGILLGYEENTVTAVGSGINLQDNGFKLSEKLIQGQVEESGIYIGTELAKKLGVTINDKMLLTTKTSEGGINGIKLPIKGIFRFKIEIFDKKFFFISLRDAKQLLKIRNSTTEIYVFTEKTSQTKKVQAEIKKILPGNLVAADYIEQMAGLYNSVRVMGYVVYFISALILFLASFVIINTMMMAVFERFKEIGTIKALGITDKEIFIDFTLEGAFIGILGSLPGAVLGYLSIIITAKNGINYAEEMVGMDYPIEYIFRPQASISVFLISIILAVIITSISAMIPAWRAKKLLPAEALRSR